MHHQHPDYPEFKEEFWIWFDNLPVSKKRVYWICTDDIAEQSYYFGFWIDKKLEEEFINYIK